MPELTVEHLPSGVVVLTIDRPHRRNALDNQTLAELHAALDAVNGDPKIRALVITGAGGAFSAGADVKATPRTSRPPTSARPRRWRRRCGRRSPRSTPPRS